ncbi:MAG: hypothetical protein Q9222_003842 [Ikaeria aurantiellina]
MKAIVSDRLFSRELGHPSRYNNIRGLYGDQSWVEDLDIVNELGGHSGCVNALSWSSSGRLLASGSDDQHLNIHTYQPDSSTAQFALNTTVSTGHSANIFSVKFMPHSNDSTVVTCAGDAEVRQFDLRLPSSAYPCPKGGRGLFARRGQHDDSNVPPPLISYKRHHLDLNTISCSATQPHYIALGGAHLHCFLHDRRMLGRDRLKERGSPGNATPTGSMSSAENEAMGAATRCVRRFAPNGRSKMRRTDNGHITACKLSDANPNELIASWSGDQIYSFDILRSPNAPDDETLDKGNSIRNRPAPKSKEIADRKRKRKQGKSSMSSERTRRDSRPRSTGSAADEAGDLALRIRYENGEGDEIGMDSPVLAVPRAFAENARESVLNDMQKRSLRIARSVVKIRKLIFSLSDSKDTSESTHGFDLASHRASFTSALGFCSSVLPEMDDISRTWRYPLDPRDEDVVFQQTLRGHRDSARRFLQASGTLAKTLGGRLQTAGSGSNSLLQYFHQIDPGPNDGPNAVQREIFCFDFLKAILLWLEGGSQALLQGFKRPANQRKDNSRFPIPDEAGDCGIDDYLIPYLLRLATPRPIPDLEAPMFYRDEHRQAFASETSAVIAFSSMVRLPLKDLSRAIMPATEEGTQRAVPVAQDSKAAMKFWGFKVGRGVLMNAGEGIDFQYVDVAFGGLGGGRVDEGRMRDGFDPDETEESAIANGTEQSAAASIPTASREASVDFEDAGSDAEMILMDDLHDEIAEHMAEHDEQDEDMDEGDDQNDDGDLEEDSDDDITAEERQFIFRSASARGKSRESVDADVPYSSHTRSYAGHCNVKTVKDANFFGLNDEFVVSGSDGGHLFIWDKKTSELVNILQGDGEVVNVVQGHPYEPLLAVSGIDSTIKIFSPDSRAQEDARTGINVGYMSNGSTTHSSITGRRLRRSRLSANDDNNNDENGATGGLASRKRMDQRDEIVRENDAQRQGGMREAFITVRPDGPFHQRFRVVELSFAEWLGLFASDGG